MKNIQISRVCTAAMLATTLSLGTGCSKVSTPAENQSSIQNIKSQTIAKRYGDKCTTILSAEGESLRAIEQATHLEGSDIVELKAMVHRYTVTAIESKIKLSKQGILDYDCAIFSEKSLLNPPVGEIISSSKILTPEDKTKLLLQLGK